jgi:hypothetical protein
LRDPLAASQNIAPRLRDDAGECAIPFSIGMLFAKQKATFTFCASKIFHICRKANISHGEAVFHPFRKEWISLKTPAAFSTPAFALNALLIHNYCLRK